MKYFCKRLECGYYNFIKSHYGHKQYITKMFQNHIIVIISNIFSLLQYEIYNTIIYYIFIKGYVMNIVYDLKYN